MEGFTRLQLTVPNELHQWVAKWSKDDGRSMNKQILSVLESIRNEQEKQAAQSAPSK